MNKDAIQNSDGTLTVKNILNAKGQPIVLTRREAMLAQYLENHINNSLGYQVQITTLTALSKKIVEQKFYDIPFAEYVPTVAGQGAWGTTITTFRSFLLGDDFSTGVVGTGSSNARLAGADAAVDSLTIQIRNWAKTVGYTLFDLESAAKSGNWDLISTLQKARKKNYDLGLQRVAFLGLAGDANVLGLFTQAGITTDAGTISTPFSKMSVDDLANAPGAIIEAYRANVLRTAWPEILTIPESDHNGLANQSSPTFPIKSKLEVLLDSFKSITGNKNFKIMPVAYGDKSFSGLATQMYALYKYDEESLRMDIPVPYTATLANSTDNFNFQNVGYGQFTGVLAYRPLELMYFTNNG